MLRSMSGLLEMMGRFLGTYVGANARACWLLILMRAIYHHCLIHIDCKLGFLCTVWKGPLIYLLLGPHGGRDDMIKRGLQRILGI